MATTRETVAANLAAIDTAVERILAADTGGRIREIRILVDQGWRTAGGALVTKRLPVADAGLEADGRVLVEEGDGVAVLTADPGATFILETHRKGGGR